MGNGHVQKSKIAYSLVRNSLSERPDDNPTKTGLQYSMWVKIKAL